MKISIGKKIKTLKINRLLILGFVLVLSLIIFTLINENFLSYHNIISLLSHLSYMAVLAAPITILFILGEIDISFGGVLMLSSMVMGVSYKAGIDIRIAIIFALMIGLVFGAINGFLVGKIGLSSMIVTLGTMMITTGLGYVLSKTGRSIPVFEKYLGMVGRGGIKIFRNSFGTTFFLPWSIIIFITIYFIFWFILKKTSFGNNVYAIGQNRRAAHLMGVKVANTVVITYILTGLYSSFAGIILTSQATAAIPELGSFNTLLIVISGIVLGGAKLGGGNGEIVGTLLGILIISIIYNGLALLSLPIYATLIITGVLFIVILATYEIRDNIKKTK